MVRLFFRNEDRPEVLQEQLHFSFLRDNVHSATKIPEREPEEVEV